MTHEHEHEHQHEHGHEHEHEHETLDVPTQIEQHRAAKDEFFASAPRSPIPTEERAAFTGLTYYPVDLAYRFEGLRLAPYAGDDPPEFEIPTSDNRLRPARRVGSLHFELGGEPRTLVAYDLSGGHSHSLFVPFQDATSGAETYGAGRYLDLEPEDDGSYALDFNLAYHPFCVYSPIYSCPMTPPENRLPLRIEAGERLPAEAATA